MTNQRAKVVVLGGGFGGLNFCRHFSHPRAEVTVVDKTNHHLFQPLLYQVAMAGLSAPDIAQPIRSILAQKPGLTVVMDEAIRVDFPARRVLCRKNSYSFDYLVLALGSVTSYFSHPEWETFAPGLKTIDDALRIRRNVLLAFEEAETETDPKRLTLLMTILVIGGGPTGVELAGACAELAHRVLRKDFDHIDPSRARIILIEGSSRILSHLPPELSLSARAQLEALGVQVRTDSPVRSITFGRVELATGEVLEAENILWAAGVKAHPLTRGLGVETDRGGRLKTSLDLSLPGHPHVFAIGDMISLQQENGHPVPGVAPAAMQMARHVARLISDELDLGPGRSPRPPFQYLDKGTLATIGRSKGVAWFGKLQLHGYVAWLGWLLIHLLFLIGFRNKLSVLVSWTYSYFTYKLGARLITGMPAADPEAPPQKTIA